MADPSIADSEESSNDGSSKVVTPKMCNWAMFSQQMSPKSGPFDNNAARVICFPHTNGSSLSIASNRPKISNMTEMRECDICQQQRVAASTLVLPCCFKQVMCLWCIAHSIEIRHSVTCHQCGESITGPFAPTVTKYKNPMRKSATFDNSTRYQLLGRSTFSSVLDKDELNELEEDRVQKCQFTQCPYNSVKMACFHCGVWLCEMHELAHTNELSDRLLVEVEALNKRANAWYHKSEKVIPKMLRLVEGFDKTYEAIVTSWASVTKKTLMSEIERKIDLLIAEARQLRFDVGSVIDDTTRRSDDAKNMALKTQEICSSLQIRGHNLADVGTYSKELNRIRNILNDLEQIMIPAPKFLPAVLAKPSAAWIREERSVSEWAAFFESEENAILEKIGDNKSAAMIGAAGTGNIDGVMMLLEHACDSEERKKLADVALFAGSSSGALEVIQLVLTKGANLHARDNSGCSPIILASAKGQAEVIRYLVTKGANILDSTPKGYTPLIAASEKGHAPAVAVLLDLGCDVNTKTLYGDTAAMFASYWGHLSTLELLISRGADINVQNNNGDSALIAASSNGHTAVVKCLVDNGADITATNNKGCDALKAASKTELRILLYSKGARANNTPTGPRRTKSLMFNGMSFFRKS